MRNIKTIYLDYDGCIVNTIEAIVGLYNEDFRFYKDFQRVQWWDVETWGFEECTCATRQQIDLYFNQPRFFNTVEFMPWARQVIDELQKSYQVKIVSMGEYPNLVGKRGWLKYYFPNIELIGIDFKEHSNKAHIDMSDGALLDDSSINLKTSKALEKICFGDSYRWNEDWDGLRAANWMDIKRYFLEESKK